MTNIEVSASIVDLGNDMLRWVSILSSMYVGHVLFWGDAMASRYLLSRTENFMGYMSLTVFAGLMIHSFLVEPNIRFVPKRSEQSYYLMSRLMRHQS